MLSSGLASFRSVLNAFKEMQWFVLRAAEISLDFWIVMSVLQLVK